MTIAKVLSQGKASLKNPTMQMAQKVFKVLTTPSKPAQEPVKEASSELPQAYGSLEELIGMEGAPQQVPPKSSEEK